MTTPQRTPPFRPLGVFQSIINAIDFLFNVLFRISIGMGLFRLTFFILFLLSAIVLVTWRSGLETEVYISAWDLLIQVIREPFAHVTWNILPRLLTIFLPLWIVFQICAIYVQDIYELDDVGLAQRFVSVCAFGFPFEVMHIEEGRVRPADRNTTIFQIGGPGFITVAMENVAVFERPDGRPDQHGPTTKNFLGIPDLNVEILDGFERLRSIIDLRDQKWKSEVSARSLDGIPIYAKDMQFLLSVRRRPFFRITPSRERLHDQPYPYNWKAIDYLVFEQSGDPLDQVISGSVRMEIRSFVESHSLSDFLAAIQQPDFNRLVNHPAYNPQSDTSLPGPVLTFVPRPEITRQFLDFSRGFSRSMRNSGVYVEWVNVGIWQFPKEIIPSQHVQAWQITLENNRLGSNWALNQVFQKSRLQELSRMTEEVLVELLELQKRGVEGEDLLYKLIASYYARLRVTYDRLTERINNKALKSDEKVSLEARLQTLREALECIQRYQVDYARRKGITIL
jgi:hypothetical protein